MNRDLRHLSAEPWTVFIEAGKGPSLEQLRTSAMMRIADALDRIARSLYEASPEQVAKRAEEEKRKAELVRRVAAEESAIKAEREARTPSGPDELLDRRLHKVTEISYRAKRAAWRCGCETLRDLLRLTASDLTEQRHFGRKSLAELRAGLGKLGLALWGEVKPEAE